RAGQPQPLLTGRSHIGSPSASADGSLLVYSERQPNGYRVVSVDMATDNVAPVTATESPEFVRVLVSGNGKVIVYGGPNHVGYRMRLNQGTPEPICPSCSWPTHVNSDGSAALFESIKGEDRILLWSKGSNGPKPLIASADPKNRRQYAGR